MAKLVAFYSRADENYFGGTKKYISEGNAKKAAEKIAELIFANKPSGVIREEARKMGMRSLRDDAIRKAEAGISTLEEVIFVTLMDEN